jgi:hypothetical protein
MDEINERCTYILTVSFYDEDDLPVVPNSATYRIDDVTTGTLIVATKAFPSLAASVDVEITKGQNSMIAENHAFETRRVTVVFSYGAARQGTDEYLYKVRNLPGVSIIASASLSASVSASASAS